MKLNDDTQKVLLFKTRKKAKMSIIAIIILYDSRCSGQSMNKWNIEKTLKKEKYKIMIFRWHSYMSKSPRESTQNY